MDGRPRVFASGARVATVDGVDFHLLTVESWGGRVAVHLDHHEAHPEAMDLPSRPV